MKTRNFEKHTKHLSQEQILTGGLSTINKLLVEKGVVTPKELQLGLLDWIKKYGLEVPRHKSKKRNQ